MTSLRARSLLNLALLLLAGGLVAVIWLGPGDEPPPEPKKLTAVDISEITRVRIESRRREPLELIREDARWRLTEPRALPADPIRVTALMGIASARVHEAFRAEGNDLAVFGLEPPMARIRLDQHEFLFGDTDPLNGWRYVLYGADVYLITDAFFHHVLATPAAFVDRSPIGADARPVAFSLPGATLRLENGDWKVSPQRDDGGAGRLLVEAWKNARASSVKSLDPALNWQRTVEVGLENQQAPIRFRVASLEHELVLARPAWNLQYHFPAKAGNRLIELGAADS
jgi:hypothetical protein